MKIKKDSISGKKLPNVLSDPAADFLFYYDATKKQRAAVVDLAESSFHHSIRRDQDKDWLQQMCMNVDQRKPEEGVVLIRYLQKAMAEELEYTVQAVRQLCKTHGISALLPTRLKIILINKTRSTPPVRAWIRKQQAVEQEAREQHGGCNKKLLNPPARLGKKLPNPPAETSDKNLSEPEPAEKLQQRVVAVKEAEGKAWAERWIKATAAEVEAELQRQYKLFAR